jgi:hypothetical protein
MAQKKNSFDKETWKKIGKGALIGIGGFIAGEGGIQILQCLSQAELGVFRPYAVVLGGIIVNVFREYFKGEAKN